MAGTDLCNQDKQANNKKIYMFTDTITDVVRYKPLRIVTMPYTWHVYDPKRQDKDRNI